MQPAGNPQEKACLGTGHSSGQTNGSGNETDGKGLKLGGEQEMLQQEESCVCFANLYKPVQNTTFDPSRK